MNLPVDLPLVCLSAISEYTDTPGMGISVWHLPLCGLGSCNKNAMCCAGADMRSRTLALHSVTYQRISLWYRSCFNHILPARAYRNNPPAHTKPAAKEGDEVVG
jgi:hypothetical protein